MSAFRFASLSARLRAVAMLGAAGILAVAVAAHFSLRLAHDATIGLVAINDAQRHQMDSDMMHDAMRGDVIGGLLAADRKDTAGVNGARTDLADHSARFLASLDKAEAIVTDSAIRTSLPALRAQVQGYSKAAATVLNAAFGDSTTRNAAYASFLGQFDAVEVGMEQFGDRIQALSGSTQAATASQFTRAMWLIWSCFALFFLASLTYAWFVARALGRRMTGVTTQVEALRTFGVEGVRRALSALARGEVLALEKKTLPRLADTSSDELAAVARAVDQMADECDASFASCVAAQQAVTHTVGEIERLAAEASIGVLDARADRTAVKGRYAEVLAGVEGILDTVSAPLIEARRVLERVAERDLEAAMTGEFAGEYARVQVALNHAVRTLANTVGQVRAAAIEVDHAAEQLSEGAQQLSEGASSQAASSEEISASLTELASIAAQAVQRATDATASARQARESVERGSTAMEALNGDMERIKQSADATQRIVKTIDEIAFQTNLLALNAAVEAARAGDAGRGFAVVAEEVRALAIRSAAAARQTAELIEDEIRNVNGGVAREQLVREQLTAARDHVEQVTVAVELIAQGVRQQSTGLEEIGRGVGLMSQVTQQVASSAEESAAASEELLGQASHLTAVVKGFKTRNRDTRVDDRHSLQARRRSAA
ncbi:MAG: methyl-accepting chemotaxis protein [Gemmatimonadetes bacterium]|nr:methyl-accepting chemotaxis protein [Gemmatimonadota bacterium]